MSQIRSVLPLAVTVIFVLSGLIKALVFRAAVQFTVPEISLGLPETMPTAVPQMGGTELMRIFLQPQNPVLWLLLLVLWAVLVLDALGGMIEPRAEDWGSNVIPPLLLALITGILWPWILIYSWSAAALLAVVMMLAALVAAFRARGNFRPALGFLAGWSTCIGFIAIAGMVGGWLGLGLAEMTLLAIIPSAVIGVIVQLRLGRMGSYSVALIWGFTGIATSAVSGSPAIAITAILALAALTGVLIRAAS